MYITVLNATKGFLFGLTSAQNKAPTPQPGPAAGIHPRFTFPTLLSGCCAAALLLHFRACFCQRLRAPAPLTHPAGTLLPALSNHISVTFLLLSLYLECPKSWALGTFQHFQISVWNPDVPLCSSQTPHRCVQSIFFRCLILGHSCLIQDAPNFTLWTEKRGSSTLFTKTDSCVC